MDAYLLQRSSLPLVNPTSTTKSPVACLHVSTSKILVAVVPMQKTFTDGLPPGPLCIVVERYQYDWDEGYKTSLRESSLRLQLINNSGRDVVVALSDLEATSVGWTALKGVSFVDRQGLVSSGQVASAALRKAIMAQYVAVDASRLYVTACPFCPLLPFLFAAPVR